jgi:hypothetical protein
VGNNIKNIILVEGTNDKIFISGLLRFLKDDNTEVDQIVSFDYFEGSDVKIITNKLKVIIPTLLNSPIEKLGIVLDIDNFSTVERLAHINEAMKIAFVNFDFEEFSIDNNLANIQVNDFRIISISYYLMQNQTGKGNTESLLKEIVIASPLSADCLALWNDCSNEHGRKISESQFLKEWINFYIRYDYCSDKKLSKHAKDNCNLEKSIENIFIDEKPKAWDFSKNIDSLNNLKEYLKRFI